MEVGRLTGPQIRQGYRSLLRHGYRAVDYKYPQTLIIRKYLAQKFRQPEPVAPQTLANTVEFVKMAAQYTGLERRCIASIVHTEHSLYERKQYYSKQPSRQKKDSREFEFSKGFYTDVLQGLNKSMDLCL